MKRRIEWVDIAKGICLIAVILGHMGNVVFNFVYSFHLPTFFMLSGYTLRKSDITYDYLKKKFCRLMIPYFITCVAVVGMDVINSMVEECDVSICTITNIIYCGIVKTFFGAGVSLNFGSIELGMGIGAIWFLPALFFALIFTQLILRLQSKTIQIALSVTMFMFSAMMAKVIWLPFSILAAMFSVPFILIGKWIQEYEILEKLKFWHYIIFYTVSIVGCCFGVGQSIDIVSCTIEDWLLTPVCVVCSSLCVIGLSRGIRRFPPLEFVGRNSLVFLCVHLFCLNTLDGWFANVCEMLCLPDNFIVCFIMEMLFVTIVSAFIVVIFRGRIKAVVKPSVRGYSVDIMRATLMIFVIMDYSSIDSGFRRFIYSFQIMVFVMIAGYLYNEKLSSWNNIMKTFKTLMLYVIFSVIYIFYTSADMWLKTLLIGDIRTKIILPDISSVGGTYFILILFLVKIVYILIDRIQDEVIKNITVFFLFGIGLCFGYCGIWLPWIMDVALVALLFYHVGYYIKKYNMLEKCVQIPAIYFPFSCIWAYMVYSGSMELAIRNYGNIGLMVAGVVSAFIIIYLFCNYLAEHFPAWLSWSMGMIGKSTAYILMLHTLCKNDISNFATNTLGLSPENVFHLCFCVMTQVFLGLCCFIVKCRSEKFIKNFTNK